MTDATQELGTESSGAESPRRRWSESKKRRIVAESYRGAQTATAVAQRHGVHVSMLFKWRRRYGKAADTGAGCIPVVVEASAPTSGRMEIVLGEDVRVVVEGGRRLTWRLRSPSWTDDYPFESLITANAGGHALTIRSISR